MFQRTLNILHDVQSDCIFIQQSEEQFSVVLDHFYINLYVIKTDQNNFTSCFLLFNFLLLRTLRLFFYFWKQVKEDVPFLLTASVA